MERVCTFLGLLSLLTAASASVMELSNDNFDSFVNGDKHAFVEFYAPWCGHCKRLAPAYEEVGQAFSSSEDVVIAKVDADAQKALGSRFGVRGYPTLKFFPKGSTEPEDYSGGRTADDIIKFISSKTGARVGSSKPPSDVVDLTLSNFDKVVLDDSKDVLVEFYAPWCGHCKSLAPVYEQVGTTYKNEENCVVARIDADGNRDIATKYSVSGYPTLLFFPKDNKEGEKYEGGRTVVDFVKYLNEKCGAARMVGGKLSPMAGVVEEMDELASDFMANSDERGDILAKAVEEAESHEDPHAIYYVKVMKKVQEKGEEFVQKENDRLGRILEGDVSAKKSDEITKKRNVLKKFEL